MEEDSDLEKERDRIRFLVSTLGNVLQKICDSAAAVGTTLGALEQAKAALGTAEQQLTVRSNAVVAKVDEAMGDLPGQTAEHVLKALDGAIQRAVRNSTAPLTTASAAASTAAAKLNSAVTISWAKFVLFAAVGGLIGSFVGALLCFVIFQQLHP